MLNKSTSYPIYFTVPVLSYLVYTFYMHLIDPFYMSAIDRVDFAIHELGHIVFMIFGNEFIYFAGGTLLQVIIPLVLLIYFFFQKDYFAHALCYAWLAANFFYIAMYSGDAIRMNLPLVSLGGGEARHDWTYLFLELGVRQHTDIISNVFFYIGVLLFMICFIFSFILLFNKYKK